jgi:hypothetical protein
VLPPFVGVAINVTLAPEQIEVELAAMVTEGVTTALTVIVTWLLVTVAGVAQAALLVITTVTISLFTRAVVVKALLFVPVFTPFTFH